MKIKFLKVLSEEQNVQVSDTRKYYSSNTVLAHKNKTSKH